MICGDMELQSYSLEANTKAQLYIVQIVVQKIGNCVAKINIPVVNILYVVIERAFQGSQDYLEEALDDKDSIIIAVSRKMIVSLEKLSYFFIVY